MGRAVHPHIITDDSALGGSVIKKSLRFNRNNITYLSRTPSSAGNRKTWTFSTWVKLGQTGINNSNDPGNGLFLSCGAGSGGANMTLRITNNGYIGIDYYGIGGYYSTGRLRDPSAWYHCVWVMDTSESTDANRMKVYVNGDLFYNNSMSLSQNADTPINNNSLTTIGVFSYNTSHAYRLDGYLAEINFIDGQALDPSNFGYTDFQTGIWRPKRFIPTGPNNRVTWSSTTQFDANVFDGDYTDFFLAQVSNGYYTATTSPFTIKQSLGVITGNGYHWGAKLNGSTEVTTGNLSGTMGVADRSIVNFDLSSVTLPLDVTNLQIKAGTGSSGSTNIYGIVVDGVVLIDGDVSNIGLNGFHLDFNDNSATTAATLGRDRSGNGNNFTPSNFSVTAGKDDDSMFDTPTNNFPTLSAVDRTYTTGVTLSNGNLRWQYNYKPASKTIRATMALPSRGKIYMEWENEQNSGQPGRMSWGLVRYDSERQNYDVQAYNDVDYVSISYGGSIWNGTTHLSSSWSSTTYYTGERSAIAIDCSNGKFWLGKVATNGATTWYANDGGTDGDPAGGINESATLPNFTTATEWIPFVGWHDGGAANSSTFYANINFGNHSFLGTVPSGFTTLSSNNLTSRSTIYNPKKHFDIVTYTGNGTTGQSITGLEFKPDLVWIKSRSFANNHHLFDSIRGVDKILRSSSDAQESEVTGVMSSFNNDGFTVKEGGGNNATNDDGSTFVAWCWKAGGTAVSNSDGTISSSVSANQEAGFSIVSWTGTGSAGTIGHGLGKAPAWVITKKRSGAQAWFTHHVNINDGHYLRLNGSNAEGGDTNVYPNSMSTTNTFAVGGDDGVNGNGSTYIAYCWTEIPGYSSFGAYTGNATSSGIAGPFVNTGFKPSFVLVKGINFAGNWNLFDDKRPGINVTNDRLFPNLASAELDGNASGNQIDIVSNGFKLRGSNADTNNNTSTFAYMAFAGQVGESPFGTETNAG